MRESLGYDVEPLRNIKFNCGRLEKFWVKNVIGAGLAGSFLEPLQATSIHTTIVQLDMFLHHYCYGTKEQTLLPTAMDKYNDFVGKMVDEFRDLIQIHYMTKRDDSPFWKFCRNELKKTDKTKYVLEAAKHRCLSMLDFEMYHGSASWGVWGWTLAGLDIVNKDNCMATIKNFGLELSAKNTFDMINRRNRISAVSLMNYDEFMKVLRERKLK